jgi:metallo-beta-lactamase family protein
MLVGYQDPGSVGGLLKEGAARLTTEQYSGTVVARVFSFRRFSAHADAKGILAWLRNQTLSAPINLVHGSQDSLESLSKALQASGFSDVTIVAQETPTEIRPPVSAAR